MTSLYALRVKACCWADFSFVSNFVSFGFSHVF